MPRTESYLLRLSKSEKDELAQRAKLQGVSIAKLIRERLGLDSSKKPERKFGPFPKPTSASVDKIREQMAVADLARLNGRIAKHKLRMPLPAAERLARKELSE